MTPSSPSSPAAGAADEAGRPAVLARSWCRVDLAGGTLDIWPLGLLHPGAVTVNLAVDLPVTCRVAAPPGAGGSRYRIELGGKGESGDDGEAGTPANPEVQDEAPEEGALEALEALESENLGDLLSDPSTSLPALVLDVLGMPPVTLTLTSASPRGGGLGASSALAVAMIAACEAWLGRGAGGGGADAADAEDPMATAARRTALARDVEARLMSLPTGTQDHWPGQLGGALALGHRPGGTDVRRIDADLQALGASLLVAYTGVSHFSAGQNWQVVRRRLDGEDEATRLFAGIARVAAAAEEALAAGDLPRLGALVGEEWSLRRQLAPGVSVPEVEALLDAARDAGAWGGKACGAGGGGCVAVLTPPSAREAVAEALTTAGGELLPLRPSSDGLSVRR